MKKLIVGVVLLIVVAGTSFAQLADYITLNAWGMGVFIPLWYETPEMVYGVRRPSVTSNLGEDKINEGRFFNGLGVPWDPHNPPRVDFRISAGTDYVGFMVQVNAEMDGAVGNGDNGAQIWVRPFGNDYLRLVMANKLQEDTLRGKVAAGSGIDTFIMGGSMLKIQGGMGVEEDSIFNRFAGGAGIGGAHAANTSTPLSDESLLSNAFFISTSPIEGLFVGLMLQGIFPDTELEKTWRLMHLGIGYQIPNIGHVRAQYIGGFTGKQENDQQEFNFVDAAKFEFAFAFTGLENFIVDAGAKYWMPLEDHNQNKVWKGAEVAISAKFGTGDFNIGAGGRVISIGAYTGDQMQTKNRDKGADGLQLYFNIHPSYNFSFGTLGLSLIAQSKLANTSAEGVLDEQSAWTQFGAGVYYSKSLDRGSITIGAAYSLPQIAYGMPRRTTNDSGTWNQEPLQTGFNGRGTFTIPILFNYWFF